jgi:YD repeat-containing protein
MAVDLLSAAEASRVFATFNLNNLAAGTYTARVTIDGQTVELPNAVTVAPTATVAAEQLQLRIVGPPAMRAGRTAAVTVEVKNVSNVDVYAPLLRLTVDGWAPKPRAQNDGVRVAGKSRAGGRAGSIQIVEIFYVPPVGPDRVRKKFLVMPLNPQNPAGILAPGSTSQIVLDGIPELGSAEVQVFVEELIPGKLLDHPASKAAYKPADMPDGAWDVIYANFIAGLGDSTTTANAILARSATYLSSIGQRPSAVQEIFSWELRKASDFDAIKQRWKIGAFGYGSNNPETRLSRRTLANGDEEVRIAVGGVSAATCEGRERPAFNAMGGDKSVLTKLSETSFELRDAGAVVSRFETAGPRAGELLLTYIDDPRQQRVSFGYTEGRLTSTSGNGKTRTIAYNSAGRVQSTTNEFGLTTTFNYDAANEHLASVTDPMGGTIAFEYYKGEGLAREHALKSKTVAGAGTVTFEYDDRGRLSRYAEGGGAEATRFTYDEQGGITATDAKGSVSRLARDPSGRITRIQNPGQAAMERIFDSLGNLAETRVPEAGVSLRTFFDEKHHVREVHDAEGNIARFDWDDALDVPTLHTTGAARPRSWNTKPGPGNQISLASFSRAARPSGGPTTARAASRLLLTRAGSRSFSSTTRRMS